MGFYYISAQPYNSKTVKFYYLKTVKPYNLTTP